MTFRPHLRACLVLGLALAIPVAASAQSQGSRPLRGRVITTYTTPVVQACNRAAVRDCQSDAEMFAPLCEHRPDRLACIDRTLTELQMCWQATGCF